MNEKLTTWEEYKFLLDDVSLITNFKFKLTKKYSLKFAIDVFFMDIRAAGVELGYPKTAEGVLEELYKEVKRIGTRTISADADWRKGEFDELSESIFEELIEKHLETVSEGTAFSFELRSMDNENISLEMYGDNPCNEDWVEEMEFKRPNTMEDLDEKLYREIDELSENHDIYYNVKMWLEAKDNGIKGVPDAVDLVHNEEYKEDALKKFAEKLHAIVSTKKEGEKNTVTTVENLELSKEQLERNDDIYNAALEFCKVMTENPNLEYDMSILGELAEDAAELLVNHGLRVRFPSVVTDEDGNKEVQEYYEV